MRTIRAGETAVSIWFSGEAVPPRRELAAMVRRALRAEGFSPWPGMAAECFAAGEDTLVLVRPDGADRRAFFFPDLEALLAGALSGPAGDGGLYALPEGYLLVVPAAEVWPALYEWGRERELPPGWERHGREQGLCLAEKTAVADLRRFFSP